MGRWLLINGFACTSTIYYFALYVTCPGVDPGISLAMASQFLVCRLVKSCDAISVLRMRSRATPSVEEGSITQMSFVLTGIQDFFTTKSLKEKFTEYNFSDIYLIYLIVITILLI